MIYVSGPTTESLGDKSLHARIYIEIKKAVDGRHEIIFPLRSDKMASLRAADFFKETARLIGSSDGVLTVLVPKDQSTPVEAATAALNDKPQCVFATFGNWPPRLIEGLPHVMNVVKIEEEKLEFQVKEAVEQLLEIIASDKPTPTPLSRT